MSNYEKITLNTWQYANTTVTGCIAGSEWLTRGYTGHEHIDEFGIINMNARMYDPLLGRMLSPDKYVQDATSIQNFNRYTYALNNPLKYTDPDGNLVFGLPLLFWGITAFIATGSTMIMTGYSPSQAFNVAATIAVTVATAGVTSSIAASGLFGNTSAIIFGSMVSSGTSFAASGGKSDLSVSFGAASYSFSRNEFGYIGNEENSRWQNFGYVLGALANLSDIGKIGDMIYNVEKKDLINHAAIKNPDGSTVISYGPGESPKYDYLIGDKSGVVGTTKHYGKMFGGIRGTNEYPIHGRDIDMKGVNTSIIKGYGKALSFLSNKGLAPYSFAYSSCSTHAGLAMWLSGVPNLFIHPYTLQASVWMWNQGITPALIQNSYHLSISK